MTPALAWVAELFVLASSATDGQLTGYLVQDVVDPLKKQVMFQSRGELAGASYQPFSKLAHAFAKANDCVLERITRGPNMLILSIIIKRRLGPEMKKNPVFPKLKGVP